MAEAIFWYGSEDDQHRECVKACKARCKQWGKSLCPAPDFCGDCEHDMQLALQTRDPQIIEDIKNGQL